MAEWRRGGRVTSTPSGRRIGVIDVRGHDTRHLMNQAMIDAAALDGGRQRGRQNWRQCGRQSARERGSVTAEFATALPAVLLCLALCVCAVQAVAQQARLLDHAASAARLIGRGDAAPAPPAGATRAVGADGGLVCVTVSAPSRSAGLGALGVTVSARSCVLDDAGQG